MVGHSVNDAYRASQFTQLLRNEFVHVFFLSAEIGCYVKKQIKPVMIPISIPDKVYCV